MARLLHQGKCALGMWVNLCDPGLAEIAALAGYDWLLIDNEHNPFTETQVQSMLHVAAAEDIQALVRVRSNDEAHIKWVLDSGAGGVVVPRIENAADARRAVKHAKYAPTGLRGYSPNRVSRFLEEHQEYVARANEDIVLICQIELASAVEDIGGICRTDGLDALWVGPADLAQSLGHIGETDHPEVQQAIEAVIRVAQKHGVLWGIPTACAQDYQRYVKRGGKAMILGSDSTMLREQAKATVESVAQFRG